NRIGVQTWQLVGCVMSAVVDAYGIATQLRARSRGQVQTGIPYRIALQQDVVGSAPDGHRALDIAGAEGVGHNRSVRDDTLRRLVGAVQPDHGDRISDTECARTAATQRAIAVEDVLLDGQVSYARTDVLSVGGDPALAVEVVEEISRDVDVLDR